MEESLRKQYAGFGWFAEPPEWREALRKLYPAEWVEAHHRRDVTDEMMQAHAKRLKTFKVEFMEPRLKQQGC